MMLKWSFFNFHLLKIHFRRFLYNNFDSFFVFFLLHLCLCLCYFLIHGNLWKWQYYLGKYLLVIVFIVFMNWKFLRSFFFLLSYTLMFALIIHTFNYDRFHLGLGSQDRRVRINQSERNVWTRFTWCLLKHEVLKEFNIL